MFKKKELKTDMSEKLEKASDILKNDFVIPPISRYGVYPNSVLASIDLSKTNKEKEDSDMKLKNSKNTNADEWVWVTGYKGTDKNMCCRGYQFDLEKQHDLPDGEEPIICEKGFHFCTDLDDVFKYYRLGDGNRFFEVRALVKKPTIDRTPYLSAFSFSYLTNTDTKKAAKSIIFVKEVPSDRLYAAARDFYSRKSSSLLKRDLIYEMSDSYFDIACESGMETAITQYKTDISKQKIEKLESVGYCEGFAKYIAEKSSGKYDFALEVASWNGLTMAERINIVLNCKGE